MPKNTAFTLPGMSIVRFLIRTMKLVTMQLALRLLNQYPFMKLVISKTFNPYPVFKCHHRTKEYCCIMSVFITSSFEDHNWWQCRQREFTEAAGRGEERGRRIQASTRPQAAGSRELQTETGGDEQRQSGEEVTPETDPRDKESWQIVIWKGTAGDERIQIDLPKEKMNLCWM